METMIAFPYKNAVAYYHLKAGSGQSYHAQLVRYTGKGEVHLPEHIQLVKDNGCYLYNSDLSDGILEEFVQAIDRMPQDGKPAHTQDV